MEAPRRQVSPDHRMARESPNGIANRWKFVYNRVSGRTFARPMIDRMQDNGEEAIQAAT